MRHDLPPVRSVLALAFALSLAPALATPAHAADTGSPATADRTFIETSYLIAPERMGDFELEGANYNDANRYAGAGFRYALEGHQELRFDVFVYPAGRAPQAEAIASGMRAFKIDIEQTQDLGHVRGLQYLSEEDFPLDAPGPATSDAPADASALDTALLRAIASARVVGKRVRMHSTLVNGDHPLSSNGYLFHRQLYFFKVRVSASRDRIGQAQFDALADLAARTLVPAIEVANIGGCADGEISIDGDAEPDEMAASLMRRTAEIQGENCHRSIGVARLDQKSEHARVVRIDFTADDWRSR